MEADEARLKREEREWERPRQARRQVIANLAEEWDKPDFTLEQKQAAIAQTLAAIALNSGGGVRFHHGKIAPVFREECREGVARARWLAVGVCGGWVP